ncbi:helix-turn-helix domain-containing protein [Acidiphilium sp.]|uniref:helix-turn-helix domain-containing protein n=1 Tax=Acidiphilium sp. TaxID=527 RepID=UPI00258549B5|nr:helix-turn-helix transcriptional regulator [Acidiphilium sp.]
MAKTGRSPIDVYVGGRIRQLRLLRCLSQTDLAEMLGITFPQVQKYERGINRVSASRLYEISRALGASIDYFFDEMPESVASAPLSGPRGGLPYAKIHN